MLGALSLTACSDDDDDDSSAPTDSFNSVCIINRGNSGANNASISVIDLEKDSVYNNVFLAANNRDMGELNQDAVRYGSKIYVTVYGSNLIEVLDSKTYKSLATIQPQAGKPGKPRDIEAHEGKLYVSLYEGYVAKIDTASLAIEDSIYVGPNPEDVTIANGQLYVAVSDGYNYGNNYEYSRVAKIDLATFKEASSIKVIVNPCNLAKDNSGNVFVVSMGNYADIPATIQKIDAKDSVSTIGEATLIACYGNTLYSIDAPWGKEEIRYISYNTLTGEVVNNDFISDKTNAPANPTGISFNPKNGEMFIGSYAAPNDYKSNGFVLRFNADGSFKAKYNVGVDAHGFVF